MRIAVLGTGVMGAGMVRSLRRAGLEVNAWNRTRDKAEPLADDGARVCGTAGEAVADADVVVLMLFDTAAVLEVLAEALPAAEHGPVWVQASTIGLEGTAQAADLASRFGAPFVDAPVLGTKQPAEQGSLVFLAAGAEELRERVAPAFDGDGVEDDLGERGAGPRFGAQARLQRVRRDADGRRRSVRRPRDPARARPAAVPGRPRRRGERLAVRARQGRDDAEGRLPGVVRARRRPQGPRPDPRGRGAVRDADHPDRGGAGVLRRGRRAGPRFRRHGRRRRGVPGG